MTKGGTNLNKDVVYIDIDDEITAIIDKLRTSDKKIVALVLPKRAAVLQSIVNMKLLKLAADESRKNVVLITVDAGLLPLAGSVGLHVAKSLNSKPEIPDAPDQDEVEAETIREDIDDETSIDKTKTVGELSGEVDLGDAIELDNDDETDNLGSAYSQDGHTPKSKQKKFKIPNFNKFRLLLILGVIGVVLLGAGGYAAVAVLPSAKITIKTDRTSVDTDVTLSLKTAAEVVLDTEKAIVPAQTQEVKKTLTQEAPATGQVNNGEKATGSIDMSTKNCTSTATPDDVSKGAGVSANGKTYITQKKATFSFDSFSGGCLYFKATSVSITAQSGGAQFNTDTVNFVIVGRSDVGASGSASGGTDDIVKIITQADIDSAKQKIGEQDTATVQQELNSALVGRDLYAIEATFQTGTTETKLSVEANAPAENVTVTQTITYTMLGVKKGDLEKTVVAEAEKKIDKDKQSILDYGFDKAVFALQVFNPDGASLTFHTAVLAGAELNVETIKKQVAGMKAGGAKEVITANPGVSDVTVEYSPFWVSAIPEKVDKITVVVQESQ